MSYIDSAINSTAGDATGGSFLGMGKKGWGYTGLGAAAVLPALFGGGDGDLSKYLRDIEKTTTSSLDTSKTLGANSQDLFASVLPYLKAVTGGDRQALLGATMPERKRVIDQYSAARKAIAEFSPRSGGQAAAMAGLTGNEASDLSMIGANARTQGIGQAASLAGGLQAASQNATAQAMSGENLMANISAQQAQMHQQQASGWGRALGLLAGLAF